MTLKGEITICSLLISLFIITGCIRNKDVLIPQFLYEIPCQKTDSIGVWQNLGLAGQTITAIATHPKKPHVIFAGSSMDFSAGIMGKLFYSRDCGKTWVTLLEGGSYTDIKFDPLNPDIIYAAPHSLIKSTDGGMNWFDISNGIKIDRETQIATIVIDPKNRNILFVGTGGFFGGRLYKSTNGGKSWQNLAGDTLIDGVISLAINPENTGIIYAGTSWSGSVYKSVDGGEIWNKTGLADTGYLIHDIEIYPKNPHRIIVGWRGISQSFDAGDTWGPFNEGLPDSAQGMKLCIDPVSLDYYCVVNKGDSGGIYRREENDSQWQKFGIEGLQMGSYYTDLKTTSDGTTLYFGPQEGGLYKIRLR